MNPKGLIKYSSEERGIQEQIRKEKKKQKRIRRRDYLTKAIQKLDMELQNQ